MIANREKLIELLELGPTATDEEILTTVAQVKGQADKAMAHTLYERQVTKLVNGSLGALRREQAVELLATRDGIHPPE